MLERELAKLAGENWQVRILGLPIQTPPSHTSAQSVLDISPQSAPIGPRSGFLHQRSNTISSQRTASPAPNEPLTQTTRAHVEQVRLLVLGMEKRLQERQEKMVKCVQRAEDESARFENTRKGILADGS